MGRAASTSRCTPDGDRRPSSAEARVAFRPTVPRTTESGVPATGRAVSSHHGRCVGRSTRRKAARAVRRFMIKTLRDVPV